jgi:ubiquinone/menaquinone biosynthesis C-methylase UbiE
MTYRNKHVRLINSYNKPEAFSQRDSFVLKQNEEIYDDFYAEIYDTLYNTKHRSQWELKKMLKLTDADTNNSTILDVGSGTGYVVNELQHAGYSVYGIDKSKDMINESQKKYPEISIKHADVMDPMNFEKLTFTHILCLNFTIYEFGNKFTFFRNCYLWMKPNAYLMLHLVDPQSLKSTSLNMDKRMVSYENGRITDSVMDFYDFSYRAQYKYPTNMKLDKKVTIKETFKDRKTKHIRQNERDMYMESINDILKMANHEGFVFHGKVSMKEYNGDDNQYLYVLERTM